MLVFCVVGDSLQVNNCSQRQELAIKLSKKIMKLKAKPLALGPASSEWSTSLQTSPPAPSSLASTLHSSDLIANLTDLVHSRDGSKCVHMVLRVCNCLNVFAGYHGQLRLLRAVVPLAFII